MKVMLVTMCLWLLGQCDGVVMPDAGLDDHDDSDYSYSLATSLRRCLDDGGGSPQLVACLSEGAVTQLARADSNDVLQVMDDVSLTLEDDDKSSRTILPLDQDPTNYRTMLGVLSSFLARRSLRWNLGAVYPGLLLHVGGGMLHLELDRRLSGLQDRRLGAGRMLIRTLLLPAIVGVKVSLAALVPLFFLLVAVAAKKALFLSKLAVLVSGFLGINSLFLFQQQPQSHPPLPPPVYLPPQYLDRSPPRHEPSGRNFVWEEQSSPLRD